MHGKKGRSFEANFLRPLDALHSFYSHGNIIHCYIVCSGVMELGILYPPFILLQIGLAIFFEECGLNIVPYGEPEKARSPPMHGPPQKLYILLPLKNIW